MVNLQLLPSLRGSAKQSAVFMVGDCFGRKASLAMTCLVALFILSSCNQPTKKSEPLKGELVFLLQYNNRLPSDVGFLTNHIMERRMANLMKDDYQPFMQNLGNESPLVVDTLRNVVFAYYGNKVIQQNITVDVANDAIWIDYTKPDTVLHYADRTSLHRPE